jgi:hypothetical protein
VGMQIAISLKATAGSSNIAFTNTIKLR